MDEFNFNDKVFYIIFGSKLDMLRQMYSDINIQLQGNLTIRIDIDKLYDCIKLCFYILLEKDIHSTEIKTFLYQFSKIAIQWLNIIGKDSNKRLEMIKMCNEIMEHVCSCMSLRTFTSMLDMTARRIKYVMEKEPAGFEMSRHYYKLLGLD